MSRRETSARSQLVCHSADLAQPSGAWGLPGGLVVVGALLGRVRSYLSPAFPDGEYGGPDPVSGEPALRWVVPGCPGQSSAVGPCTALVAPLTFRRGRWPVPAPRRAGARACFPGCPGESVNRCCAHSPLSDLAGHVRLGSRAQRTSLELSQSRTQVEAGQRSAGPPLAGLCPRRLPGWPPCHTAVLRSMWPRALGAARPLLATQSVLTPPGPAGRGQEGGKQGAGLRLGGLPQAAEGLGGTGASKAGGA